MSELGFGKEEMKFEIDDNGILRVRVDPFTPPNTDYTIPLYPNDRKKILKALENTPEEPKEE